MAIGCRSARFDEEEGYQCEITGCRCEFLFPDEKACYKIFGEGPLAFEEERKKKEEIPKKLVKSKYLAFGLSWLGFRFTVNKKGQYLFDNTEKFQEAWDEMLKLRRKLGEVK